ncbi:MAG: hypothetical protein ACK5PF_09755 [bacterium]
MTLAEARALSEADRRIRWIQVMQTEELNGYEAEAKRRGLEPYEVSAIARRRKELVRR